MKKFEITLITLFFMFLVLFSQGKPALASTKIEAGDVSGVWTAEGSPYIVMGDIKVKENETLIIKPGVEIRFAKDAKLEVNSGEGLTAEGTKDSMIVFTSNETNPAPGDWDGIKLTGTELTGTENKAILKYCLVEYAIDGIKCTAFNSCCDSYDNYSKIISCVIRNNSHSGIHCEGSGDPGCGCAIPEGRLTDEMMKDIWTGECEPTIQFNRISGNGEDGIECHSDRGYYSSGAVYAKIYGNIITANKGDGISCYGYDKMEPRIIGNNIIGNSKSGISFGKNFSKDSPITNNIIAQNNVGIKSTAGVVPDCQFNDVWNNGVNYEGMSAGQGDISVDPLFVDDKGGNYHLQPTSPCIDAGRNENFLEKDFERNSRPFDGNGDGDSIIDIGAYEFIPPPPTNVKPKGLLLTMLGEIKRTELLQNYPNPSNPETWIPFLLGESSKVVIRIYDVKGRLIRALDMGFSSRGLR